MTPLWRSVTTARRGRWRAPRLRASIRARLTLWYSAILALVLLLCSGAIYVTEQQSLRAQVDSQLAARLRQWAAAYDERSGRLAAARDPDIAQGTEVVLLLTPTGRVVQTLAAGRLSAVKAPWDQAVRTLQAVARGGTTTVVERGLQLATPAGASKDVPTPVMTTRAALFRLTGRPLTLRGRVAALLVVGVRSDVPQQMATLARTLATIVPLTLLLCAGGGYWLATRALRPIRTITRTAQEIGATDLTRRLNLRGGDEVGQLAATIDHMLGRLDAAFGASASSRPMPATSCARRSPSSTWRRRASSPAHARGSRRGGRSSSTSSSAWLHCASGTRWRWRSRPCRRYPSGAIGRR